MATESISGFFKRLGFELRNVRNSWGAKKGDAVLLRTWDDEMLQSPRRVRVFGNQARPGGTTPFGRNERMAHLRALWKGGVPGYTVIVTPRIDKNTSARTIGDFRSDVVFAINSLEEADDQIFAVLGAPVPAQKLDEHILSHRTEANARPFPASLIDTSLEESADPASKALHLAAAVREYLIDAARRSSTVPYGELFDAFDLNRLTVGKILSRIGHRCIDGGEPILTALVVLKETGRCSTGLEREFGVNEDEERLRVYSRWAPARSHDDVPVRREWTDEELQAAVASYVEMMSLDAKGTTYVKSQFYRRLAVRFGRVEGAFERRMQNISHLLDARGLPWLQGLNPQENVGANVEPRLIAFLSELFDQLTPLQHLAEEIGDIAGVIEGARKQVIVNAYERDPLAKPRCIRKWGCICVVCNFDFQVMYGDLGEGFIHVHHLTPIHTIGEAYVLDPENDLRPVCPNCHAMLHRKKDVLSIEELVGHLQLRFETGFKVTA